MRIYERYFARQIYLAFIFILFAFSGLFFFFDLINELNTVGHGNYKFGLAVLRVALQTPSRFYEIIPVAALISAIYVFAQMAAASEFTIFRVSGLSTGKALRSLLIDQGIEAIVQGEALEQVWGTLPLGKSSLSTVWVPDDAVATAEPIVADYNLKHRQNQAPEGFEVLASSAVSKNPFVSGSRSSTHLVSPLSSFRFDTDAAATRSSSRGPLLSGTA